MAKRDKNDAREGQSEEDRLLEKAKRYVEKQEREKGRGERDDKKKRSHRDREDDDRRHKKRSKDRHHKSSSRRDRDRDRDKRKDEDDRRRSKKSKKDRKHRDKKKHSKDHKDDGHRAKPPSPSKLYPLGPIATKPPADPIDAEADYFAYHQHFRLFLYRTKGIHFEDLSSTETHKLFGKFADKFNDGELEEGYYQAKLPEEALDQCKRTQHIWSFKTNATEQQSLEMVRAGVKKQTEWSAPSGGNAKQASGPGPAAAAVPPRSSDDRVGDEHGRRGRETTEEIQRHRTANRRLREHVKATHEELTGGKADYGRERQMEKKREKADKMHGGHRDREAEAMGGPDLDDEALYGGGRDASFQQALAREKSRKARREQQRSDRIGELQKKEDDKAKAMLEMLGLSNIKPGQKIQIAPRKD